MIVVAVLVVVISVVVQPTLIPITMPTLVVMQVVIHLLIQAQMAETVIIKKPILLKLTVQIRLLKFKEDAKKRSSLGSFFYLRCFIL